MKIIFLQIIFVLFLCVNAQSEDQPVYVELICAPDTEWEGMASKNKKISIATPQSSLILFSITKLPIKITQFLPLFFTFFSFVFSLKLLLVLIRMKDKC